MLYRRLRVRLDSFHKQCLAKLQMLYRRLRTRVDSCHKQCLVKLQMLYRRLRARVNSYHKQYLVKLQKSDPHCITPLSAHHGSPKTPLAQQTSSA